MNSMTGMRKWFENENNKRSYYAVYTLCFLILTFILYSGFLSADRSLIWYYDGWQQHFRALVYYGEYLKEIVRNLLSAHRLVIPEYDFSISEGSDILGALHYYVAGDPIALLSVFVPGQYTHILFCFSSILRLYLSGIVFSVFAFGNGLKNRYGIIAGALSYAFCDWGLINAVRHPYFIDPMIYFPLIILGIEKIIRRERPYLFILTVAIAAVSNFYFFYIIVIMTVLYALIRLAFLYWGDLKKYLLTVFRIGVMSIVSVCIAGVVLLPVMMMFLQDSRRSVTPPFHLFYPLSYYSLMPYLIFTNNLYIEYWLCIGLSVPVTIAVFTMFIKKKENRLLKALFGVCVIIMIFPVFGRILNGMSYATNRWAWAFVLLCAYIFAKEWEGMFSLSGSRRKKVLLCSIVLLVICLLSDISRTAEIFSAFPLFLVVLLIMNTFYDIFKDKWKQQISIILIACLSIINFGSARYSINGADYMAECIRNSTIWEEFNNDETRMIGQLSGGRYTRYSGQYITPNANMSNNISSTQYYWSISNPYMHKFRTDLEMREALFSHYEGYDDRTAALALSSVQYYVTSHENGIPYGYRFIESGNVKSDGIGHPDDNTCFVYENQYTLPPGYCYDSFITPEIWESLDPVRKQEIQLEAVYLNEAPEGIEKYSGEIADYKIPYTLECEGNEIIKTETGFVTTANNQRFILSFEGKENSEIYFRIKGLEFSETPVYDMYFGDESVDPLNLYDRTDWKQLSPGLRFSIWRSKLFRKYESDFNISVMSPAGVIKDIDYRSDDAELSGGRHNFIVNMGYTEEPVNSAKINLPSCGTYIIDDIELYCVPMDGYEEKIGALQENTLQNITFGTDSISGDIAIDSQKLLCMAIPYSPGWSAYVNGEETPVLQMNERYLGISLPAGSNKVEFRYHRPFQRAGLVLTLAGIAAFIAVVILTEKSRKKQTL